MLGPSIAFTEPWNSQLEILHDPVTGVPNTFSFVRKTPVTLDFKTASRMARTEDWNNGGTSDIHITGETSPCSLIVISAPNLFMKFRLAWQL